MAMFLNFDINSFAVPVWVYLLVAIVGIAAPLIAAAYPVWRGTATPVRVALTDFGLSQTTFGASAFDRALARIGGTFSPIVLRDSQQLSPASAAGADAFDARGGRSCFSWRR